MKQDTKTQDPQDSIVRNILLTLPICFLLVFLIDGFLLYPIPAPAGTFDLDNSTSPKFELTGSSAPYADAEIVDSYTVSPDTRIYLVNENGQLRLLDFRIHFVTRRIALKRDIPSPPMKRRIISLAGPSTRRMWKSVRGV